MAISTSISRLSTYYGRHGLGATLHRLSLAASRALFSSRMVLFYCDLTTLSAPTSEMPGHLRVERHLGQAHISPQDLQEITSFWHPDLARHNINVRFQLGASLWLIRIEDQLAGYGWTLQGRTVEPHFFPLGAHDVHLFDFHVFPQYRGRGLNPLLVNHILRSLAAECQGRAFIEAAEWNHAQLASLRKTPFHHLSSATKFTIFGRTTVCWARSEGLEQEKALQKPPPDTPGRQLASMPEPPDGLQSTEAR